MAKSPKTLLSAESADGLLIIYYQGGALRLKFKNDTVGHDSSIPVSLARELEEIFGDMESGF